MILQVSMVVLDFSPFLHLYLSTSDPKGGDLNLARLKSIEMWMEDRRLSDVQIDVQS